MIVGLCTLDVVRWHDANSSIGILRTEPVVIHFIKKGDSFALRYGQVARLGSLESAISRARYTYVYKAVASPSPDIGGASASAGSALA